MIISIMCFWAAPRVKVCIFSRRVLKSAISESAIEPEYKNLNFSLAVNYSSRLRVITLMQSSLTRAYPQFSLPNGVASADDAEKVMDSLLVVHALAMTGL